MQHTHLFRKNTDYMKELIIRIYLQFSRWSNTIKNTIYVMQKNQHVRYTFYIILSALFLLTLFIYGGEFPAGYYTDEETGPKSSLSGYIVDRYGEPIKGALVHVLEDTTVRSTSDSSGFYTLNNMTEGINNLSFAHEDYEDDIVIIDLDEGVDDTLKTSVILTYAFHIVAGKVIHKGKPVPCAGVTVCGHPVNALTDRMGNFILTKVPKESCLKLICAKSGKGFNTVRQVIGHPVDTVWVSDIELIYEGTTIHGIVYDTNGAPADNVIVSAVGGGLTDVTNSKGRYKIKNMVYNEPSVCIFAIDKNGSSGAAAKINIECVLNKTSVDIYMKPATEIRKENDRIAHARRTTINDDFSETGQNIEYPSIDINTLIQTYMWIFAQKTELKSKST